MVKNVDTLITRDAFAAVKIYTNSPTDSMYMKPTKADPDIYDNFTAGILTITTKIQGGQIPGIIRVWCKPLDETIAGGMITRLKEPWQ
jgi:hypothetical protein